MFSSSSHLYLSTHFTNKLGIISEMLPSWGSHQDLESKLAFSPETDFLPPVTTTLCLHSQDIKKTTYIYIYHRIYLFGSLTSITWGVCAFSRHSPAHHVIAQRVPILCFVFFSFVTKRHLFTSIPGGVRSTIPPTRFHCSAISAKESYRDERKTASHAERRSRSRYERRGMASRWLSGCRAQRRQRLSWGCVVSFTLLI